MLAVVPIKENKNDAQISTRFARTPYFAIINTELNWVNILDNPYSKESSSTGKIILEWLTTKHKVDTLIAFELGIKVQQLSKAKKLQLILIDNKNRTLQKILDLLKI